MSSYFSGLNVAAFTIGGGALLAYLQDGSVRGDNDNVDARGVADRYVYDQTVKQGQTIDFTALMPGVSDLKASNLDVTLWTIGGTSYLANLRSCKINVTNPTKERSGLASAYKIPYFVGGTQVEITADHLVITAAALTDTLLTGVASAFEVVAALTFAGEAFSAPMILKSSRHSFNRGDMQMENVSLSLHGTPTGPSDSTLFSTALLGTAAVSVVVDTGANTYDTGAGQLALITKMDLDVQDAAVIKQTVTLEIQGGLTVVAGV